MQATAKGMRLQIGFFGRRNAGKSSLLNRIAGQDVVIVSDVPGTTADPVDKAMELPPAGPVLLIDTAGIDDDQETIGALRVERSLKVLDRCDLALLAVPLDQPWSCHEDRMIQRFRDRNIPFFVVFTKGDLPGAVLPDELKQRLTDEKIPYVEFSAVSGNILPLLEQIIALAPVNNDRMLADLVRPMEPVLLITPIDKEAPKGRMIMPQVQAIRDVLDSDAWCVVVRENAIEKALSELKTPPCLAVTDSQAFGIVAPLIPESVPLTSFSILMARLKGDLAACAAGAAAIAGLQDGAKVLIAEACTHHAISDDIGRVKLPRWISEYTGKQISFHTVSGPDFPDDLEQYDLVIHCGACTFNRRAVLTRILRCQAAGVPFTNYGVAIAFVKGILPRALSPFPDLRRICEEKTGTAG